MTPSQQPIVSLFRAGRLAALLVAGSALLVALPAAAQTVRVKLKLPVRAALDLEDRSTLAVAPFIVVRQEGEASFRGRNIDVKEDFHRYLMKVLRRDTGLTVQELGAVDYPSFDFEILARDRDFWRALGERADADLILTGSLDFDIQDRSGYRLEEYVSEFDGRTYYRQVLVEETGFEFDILMQVFDGRSGELLYSDNFKDFKTLEGTSADPVAGMFQNLYALEDRIVGVFAQKDVEATRVLFRP
ncbi:MAG TPA: hypothetical protein VMT16_13280 [Thermoanaerobaculia bacterium]|nr:hypothetical protein [Thermoanaerobaculia bacterium]